MTGVIRLDGKAVVCFFEGPRLTLFCQDLNDKSLPELEANNKKSRRQIIEPREVFPISLSPSKTTETEGISSADDCATLTCATFSNDAQFLAVSDNKKTIFIFNVGEDQEWNPLTSFQIEKRAVVALKFVEGSDSLVFFDKGGEVYLIQLKDKNGTILSKSMPKKILGHCSYITDMILVGANQIITCDRDAKIRVSLFPEGFVTENYFLGHKKSIVGIEAVCFEKFLLSVAVDGECILWALKTSEVREDEEVLNINLVNLLKLEENSVIERFAVTTCDSSTVFGVKVSISADSKALSLFKLVFENCKGKDKGFSVHHIQTWKYEDNEAPADFVLVRDLVFESHSKGAITCRRIEISEDDDDLF